MKTIEFFISIPLVLLKGLSICINILIMFLILFIPAILFIFLSIFSYEYFWEYKWCGMINSLTNKKLLFK